MRAIMSGKKHDLTSMRGRGMHYIRETWPRAKTISDSPKPLRITVTSEDVKGAKPKDPAGCAGSRSCNRTFGTDGAIIGLRTAYLLFKNHVVRFRLSSAFQRQVIIHDTHNAKFDPGSYELMKVGPKNKLGLPRNPDRRPKGGPKARPTKKRVYQQKALGLRALA